MEEHEEYKSFRTGWYQVLKDFGWMIYILFLVVLYKNTTALGKVGL